MNKQITYHPETLTQIENAAIPNTVHAALRQRARKEIAGEIRNLLKRLGIQNVSVTTPNYSMAQSVDVRLPNIESDDMHERKHAEIDALERSGGTWLAYGDYCDVCKRRAAARAKLEKIIIAAFPDLDDRSDSRSDYFDYRFTVD